jgi:hypothetical protein
LSDTIGQYGDDFIIQSILKNKFILDYGTMLNISDDGTTCDVQHQVLNVFNGLVLTTPMVTKQVEILYLSSSSISFDTTPINNDPCLILGLKRFIDSTKTPMRPPYAPLSPIAYERSTIKVVPLSALNNQSGLIFRAKGGKLRLKNKDETLATVLSDFMDKVVAIVTAPKALIPGDITCPPGGGPATGAIPSVSLSSTSQSDLNAIKTRLLKILEP